MSDGGLVVMCFVSSVFVWFLVIWASLRAVKRRMVKWNGNLSAWFIISIGNFGQRQIENWKRWGEYDESQAKIVIKYQLLCWLWMILWVLASMATIAGYKEYEGPPKIRGAGRGVVGASPGSRIVTQACHTESLGAGTYQV